MSDNLGLLVCENIAEEAQTVISRYGWQDARIMTFPALCSVRTPRWDDMKRIIAAARRKNAEILLIGGGCLAAFPGRDQELQPREMLIPESCFYLLTNRGIVDRYLLDGAYLMTPAWVRRWRRHIATWGFDQETARAYFRESINKFVLLDTLIDIAAPQHTRDFCDFLGMTHEILPVGWEVLALRMEGLVQDFRKRRDLERLQTAADQAKRQSADYAMIYDLISQATAMTTEEKAIETIMNLFSMLFAPRNILYLQLEGGKAGRLHGLAAKTESEDESKKRLLAFHRGETIVYSDHSFMVAISHLGDVKGIVEVSEVAFGEYKHHYLNMAKAIAQVCGLAVENARNYQKIQHMATTDELTGLFNRRQFFAVAEREFRLSRRYGRDLSAIMIDIDRFKQINDAHGHQAGDEVLRILSGRLRENLRGTDIIGRYGGEEFSILLPETEEAAGRKVAEDIRRRVMKTPFRTKAGGLHVTVSLGVAGLPEQSGNLETLLGLTDAALYQAKQAGRNRVVSWSLDRSSPKETGGEASEHEKVAGKQGHDKQRRRKRPSHPT